MSEKSINIYSKEGTKIMAIFDENGSILNGYDHDKEHASKYLKPNIVYTVDETEVHSWHTKVYLKEFPGIAFNSVHFTPAKKKSNAKKKITTKHKH